MPTKAARRRLVNLLEKNPLWYKDAVIYQLHIRSFYDSNGDGIGDLRGLTQKLDYLERLGVSAVWLLPFYPSPLRDDGYDTSDYFGIHEIYGTMRDFKELLREAHRRGIRVITELVLNHTSDQHEWFQRSRRAAPGTVWRDFYVWSDRPDRYSDARIIFKDFETSNWTWDPVAKAYYWHRFYSHQPDLNFDNPRVHKALFKVIDFWMDMGVDGMRLDAVPYLYEREGTNCENLPETYEFLRKLRAHIDNKYSDRMLLAEANQWPEDAAAYFGSGDVCNMAFHFPLMPRMFMALQMENWFPIVDILEQTPPLPETAQWAIFLRNHDELTLEMVTDEERDYMYRYYAQDPVARINLGIRRRLAPLMKKSRRRIEIMNILLFSLPGTPILYYGDEIGMGDNHYLGDRNGVRTPMQWSADRNAGFSPANPQRLFLPVIIDPEYHYETINVETEERNLSSMLWWTRRVLAMRRRFKAFARGEIEFVSTENANVFAFIRRYEDEVMLVVVNLSRFAQVVELDLSDYAGLQPMDVFSSNHFPAITRSPYILTMGFHDYFWLQLVEPPSQGRESTYVIPEIATDGDWTRLFSGRKTEYLESKLLPAYLSRHSSTGCKQQTLRTVTVLDVVAVRDRTTVALLLFIRVQYQREAADTLLLPVAHAVGEAAIDIEDEHPGMIIAHLKGSTPSLLYDASQSTELHKVLYQLIRNKKVLKGRNGRVQGYAGRHFKKSMPYPQRATLLKAGSRNTSLVYDNDCYFKLYRRLEEGVNPDVELTRFLSERNGVAAPVPEFLGGVEYHEDNGTVRVAGMLCEYVDNTGDAKHAAMVAAVKFYEEVLSRGGGEKLKMTRSAPLFELPVEETPLELRKIMGLFPDSLESLTERAAELHTALAQHPEKQAFAPEKFTMLYQRSLYQSMQSKAKIAFSSLQKRKESLPENLLSLAERILTKRSYVMDLMRSLLKGQIAAKKTRIHGDFHLGQFLITGSDYVIKDFEGSKTAALSERRLKRSPLRDLASLIHSLYMASHEALVEHLSVQQTQIASLDSWKDAWFSSLGQRVLQRYFLEMKESGLIPDDEIAFLRLAQLFLLDKAFREVAEAFDKPPATLDSALHAMSYFVSQSAPEIITGKEKSK
jgi:maltose alpha-D-glucosyltransferase/alpha-amylase